MSITITTSIHSHNDEPSAIGVVELQDRVVGKVIVSDEIPHDISSHQGSIIKITVGDNLMELKITASPEQYAEIKTLLDKVRDSSEAASMLLKLAYLCADRSIPCVCELGSNTKDLEAAVKKKHILFRSSVKGLLAWSPLSVWEYVDGKMLPKLSNALVLKLDVLLKDAPKELTYDEQREIHDQINSMDFSLLKFSSLRYLLSFVAQAARNLFGGEDWPASSLEPLLKLGQLPYFSCYESEIEELVIDGLRKGGSEISKEAKLRFVQAVSKISGPKTVLSTNRPSTLAFSSFCKAVQLDTDTALVACLTDIPAAFAAELGRAEFARCLEHWNLFSDEGKQELVAIVSKNLELLFSINSSLRLPKEIARLLSQEDVITQIEGHPQFVQFISDHLDQLRALPKRIFDRLNTANFRQELARNFKSFALRPEETVQFILDVMKEGHTLRIIEQLPDISDRILKKVDKEGHALTPFKKDCKVLTPDIYEAYLQKYTSEGPQAARQLAEQTWDMLDQLTAPGKTSDEIRNHPLYQNLLNYAYPDNTMDGAVNLEHCSDRSDDFEDSFEVPTTPIKLNLGGAVTMVLRNNLEAEPSVVNRVENLVQGPVKLSGRGESLKADLTDRLVQLGCQVKNGEIHLGVADLLERVQSGEIDPAKAKRALVAYHAWRHPNFTQYAADSVDRAEQAPNRDYAYLLELRDFLTTAVIDSLNEAVRRKHPDDRRKVDILSSIAKSIFDEEVSSLDRELLKYVAKTSQGETTRDITAVFAKNAASAGMRRVAGVCVSVDNPDAEGENENLWDMVNYLQLVLRDERTRRCVGGVLLHYYEEQGKCILAASLNPSSTLLYKVDEEAMFSELLRILGDFALTNNIDIIAVSENLDIRTNRTGGLFERAMDKQIRLINQTFTLENSMSFSHEPPYTQQDLDVIWRREDHC